MFLTFTLDRLKLPYLLPEMLNCPEQVKAALGKQS